MWYNFSVPYPKPGLAENPDDVELGAGFGYGTLIHYLRPARKEEYCNKPVMA